MNMLVVALVTFVSGIVQTVTGFGAGIIIMLVLPLLYGINISAGLSGVITVFLTISLVYRYRNSIELEKVLIPSVIFFVVSTIAIRVAVVLPVDILKMIFSLFIIVLAIYFNFFNGIRIKDKPLTMMICSTIAGIGSGLFGISGPPMVMYYLAACDTKEKYLGTIQTFFLITGLYATVIRVLSGIITTDLLMVIIVGTICILAGKRIGTLFVDKVSMDKMKRIIYIFLGITGIIQFLQCIL